MNIVTDSTGKIVMFSDGHPIPPEGGAFYELRPEQEAAMQLAFSQPNGGVTFDGESFVALPAPAPPKPRAMCSAWQFRKELRERNMLEDVIQLVANSGVDAQEAFDYASEFWSDNPMLLGLAASLPTPLTESEVYDMIVSASKRVVGTA